MLLVNSPAAHGHHAHGAPMMTEVEQKRQRACLMTLMYAIARSPTGWYVAIRLSLIVVGGEARTLSSERARKTGKRLRISKAYYRKGYATNVELSALKVAL
ncbi:hypothetical protein KCP77_16360 [Salmonella enterica subsp. enterica]|nr:hypothetical protein KCP77_16360 [Salmonella enterica subsp. enterica]